MTVYAVQNPHWHKEGEMRPKFDLSPAEKFGPIEELLSPTAKPFRPRPIRDELMLKLKDFSDDDYIICIGNPILISMAVVLAADFNDGFVNLLQWNGFKGEYVLIEADFGFTSDD